VSDARCRDVLAEISAYLDGELAATACSAIEEHCQACAACADVIAGLRRTIGLCRQAGAAEVPAAVRERARAQVRRLLEGDTPPDR
jgi:anti-sigma factor RsiW